MYTLILTTVLTAPYGCAISSTSIPGFETAELANIAAEAHKAETKSKFICFMASVVQTQTK